jgi:hypothetical protein
LIESIAAARLKTLAVFVTFDTAAKPCATVLPEASKGGIPAQVELWNCVQRLFASDSQVKTVGDGMVRHSPQAAVSNWRDEEQLEERTE